MSMPGLREVLSIIKGKFKLRRLELEGDKRRIYVEVYRFGKICPSELALRLGLPIQYVSDLSDEMVVDGVLKRDMEVETSNGVKFLDVQRPLAIAG